MKILHVWNTAGVGSIIAKFMDKIYGTESWLVHRRDFDHYGLTTYGELWASGARVFALRCLIEARKYDIIHVHSLEKIVPFLKLIYPRKPVVLHYHGSEIRDQWSIKRRFWNKADLMFYSTQDLSDSETPKSAFYIPNPVDLDIFTHGPGEHARGTATHFSYRADDLAGEYVKKYGLKLEIYDKNRHGRMPHAEVPEFLRRFEYYIDVKRDPDGDLWKIPLSKTALEALACGLKVINWEGKEIDSLPIENFPENVVKVIFEKYLRLIPRVRDTK